MLRILLTLFAMVLFGCGADAQTRAGNMPRTPGTPARSSAMTPTTSPIVAPGAIPMVVRPATRWAPFSSIREA